MDQGYYYDAEADAHIFFCEETELTEEERKFYANYKPLPVAPDYDVTCSLDDNIAFLEEEIFETQQKLQRTTETMLKVQRSPLRSRKHNSKHQRKRWKKRLNDVITKHVNEKIASFVFYDKYYFSLLARANELRQHRLSCSHDHCAHFLFPDYEHAEIHATPTKIEPIIFKNLGTTKTLPPRRKRRHFRKNRQLRNLVMSISFFTMIILKYSNFRALTAADARRHHMERSTSFPLLVRRNKLKLFLLYEFFLYYFSFYYDYRLSLDDPVIISLLFSLGILIWTSTLNIVY